MCSEKVKQNMVANHQILNDGAGTTKLSEFKIHWPALLAAALGTGFGVATLVYYTTGLFVPGLRAEFGWTLSQISLLPLMGCVLIILTSQLVGRIVDKTGVRIFPALSLAALALSFVVLTHTGASFTSFMAIWIGMHIFSACSTPVSFTRIVTARFRKARGLALGMTFGCAGLVAFLVPRLIGTIIEDNWRNGYFLLAGAVAVVAMAYFLLLPKHEPEVSSSDVTVESSEDYEVPASLSWRLSAIFLFIPLAVSGMTLHLVPMLRASGVSAAEAAGIMSYVGMSVVIGRVGVGFLVDYFFAPRVAATIMVIVAAAFGVLLTFGPEYSVIAAIGLGFALGTETDLIGYLTARYYGTKRYGRIFGKYYAVFNVGLGCSPFLVAKLYESTGAYTVPLSVSVILLLCAGGLFLTLPKFRHEGH